MADTGEKRQILGRAIAQESETVRASRKIVAEERSTAKAAKAAFGRTGTGPRRTYKKPPTAGLAQLCRVGAGGVPTGRDLQFDAQA